MLKENRDPLNSAFTPLLSTKEVNLETDTVAITVVDYFPSDIFTSEIISNF